MMHAKNRFTALPALMALVAFAACGGPSKVGNLDQGAGRTQLQSVEFGRLVDVYSYRRIDPAFGDRRMRGNRTLELIEENVVVRGGIQTQPLYDAAGNPVETSNYEYLRFDKNVGHEQLVILWDDRDGPEQANFKSALASAKSGLSQVPAAYRGQNTATRSIPIVPRNAAIKLTFSSTIDLQPEFFVNNPSAVQVLEFKGDPNVVDPVDAFRILPARVFAKENSIIVDTTILGGEAAGGIGTPGLPQSADQVTANIRIALPTRGSVVPDLYVLADQVEKLNGVDSTARQSVIRDFRSGNLADGTDGRLSEPEAPMIVAALAMGISSVDPVTGEIGIQKRAGFVPIRGRYPFVEGPLEVPENTPPYATEAEAEAAVARRRWVAAGPLAVPQQRPLRSGDILTQDVVVALSNGSFETVTVRAEVLENKSIRSSTLFPNNQIGRAADGSQGELLTTTIIRVADTAPARDSEGRPVSFKANSSPLGEDCVLRAIYVEESAFTSGAGVVSDSQHRDQFIRIDPQPGQPGQDVSPFASIAIEFTKPMDLDQIDNSKNYVVTALLPGETVPSAVPDVAALYESQMGSAKQATRHVVPTRLADLLGDGTVLRLQAPLGLAHRQNSEEQYFVHLSLGSGGVADLAGQALEIFTNPSSLNPLSSWWVGFTLDSNAATNRVGWHSWLFESEDEDGSPEGSIDIFGQYRLEGGRLTGASALRFKRSANSLKLGAISRITRGECWSLGDPTATPPIPPSQVFPALPPPLSTQGVAPISPSFGVHPGLLYWNPKMSDSIGPNPVPAPVVYEYYQTLAQPVGRVIEPMKPQGSRMQMRYIEDDFQLSYTLPSDFAIDVEQLYWSPFNDEQVRYDTFDRFTMSLAHSRKRPDEHWFLDDQGLCVLACESTRSGLVDDFAENILQGTNLTPVFSDKVYAINPNTALRDADGFTFVPFPKFDRSYTWRDSRLVTVDADGNVIGLGGAQDPNAASNNDWTANIDSPWIQSVFGAGAIAGQVSIWTQDPADFVGSNQRDHDPIALPLLVDFKIFPDDAVNGSASGGNAFQVATLGPPSNGFPPPPIGQGDPGGYYDFVGSGCGGPNPWPRVRVHASGGKDLQTGADVLVDPANVLSARNNVVKDAGLGSQQTALLTVAPGDGMLNWARADFVRKVSTVTFGFFDTLAPQRSLIGAVASNGAPYWGDDTTLRISNLVVNVDPPLGNQPAGTTVVVEMRGAETFGNSTVLYDQLTDDAFDTRGNLLNPNYACEAYRYSTANVGGAARIPATGLTQYITEDQVDLIRDAATGLLPRYMNMRLVMTNNIDVTPALSPSLRSMNLVYRLQPSGQ